MRRMRNRRSFLAHPTRLTLVVALSVAAVAGFALAGGVMTAAPSAVGPEVGATVDGATQARTVRVGIKPLDPFVVRSGSQYSGFSIELWDEIARRNAWATSYVWYDTLPPLLDDATASRLDVGIAGISITQERESRLDFSYPMFNAGLQVIAQQRADGSWTGRAKALASTSAVKYLGGLLVVILIAGNVVWLYDRQHQYGRGLSHGMFRAAAVGLVGDLGEPSHSVSDAVRIVWAIVGICFVSAFTASLTTELTVRQIQGNIRGVSDLVDKRVVTVQGSTAAAYLTDRRIGFEGVDSAETALARLEGGDADAMVFDMPVLQRHLQVTGSDRLALVGNVFQREDYGIAMPAGSPLRKAINETLLAMRADGAYDRIYEHYFGRVP